MNGIFAIQFSAMYKQIIRPLLFNFDPESVHHFTFKTLKILNHLPFVSSIIKHSFKVEDPRLEKEVFGLRFKNPIGLAAGFDKDGKLYEELNDLGFGFIEIGTLTPLPQPGNPKKRLFRLKKDKAIINRMGFNNEGVEKAVERLKHNKNVLIGGNIGKNKATPNENAVDDYIKCFDALFPWVDYFVVNVSSPNTPNLRELQDKKPLMQLLETLQDRNLKMAKEVKAKPILLKIAPDLTDSQLLDIIDIVETTGISGIIATNTTISREGLTDSNKSETGGMSGAPLTKRANEVVKFLVAKRKSYFPIIGVGGIHTVEDAIERLESGADLIQLYTGFIYEGPALIKNINKELLKRKAG